MARHTDQALKTARAFRSLLHDMERTYDPRVNDDMTWVLKHQEQLERWISMLESAEGPDDINELWGEVRNISHLMGCSLDDELGQRYRQLEHEFFNRVLDLVVDARRRK